MSTMDKNMQQRAGEVHFQERPEAGGEWKVVRNYWQFLLSVEHVEEMDIRQKSLR